MYNISKSAIQSRFLASSEFIDLRGHGKNSVTTGTVLNFTGPSEYIMFTLADDNGYITDLQSVSLILGDSPSDYPYLSGSGTDLLVKFPRRNGFPSFRDEHGPAKPRHFVISFSENPMDHGVFASTGKVNLSFGGVQLIITFPPHFKPSGNVNLQIINRYFNKMNVLQGMAALQFID